MYQRSPIPQNRTMDAYLFQVEHALERVLQLQKCSPSTKDRRLSSQQQPHPEISCIIIPQSTPSSPHQRLLPPVNPFGARESNSMTTATTAATTTATCNITTTATFPYHLPSLRRSLRTLDRAMNSLEEKLLESYSHATALSLDHRNLLTRDQVQRSLHDGILSRLFTELSLFPDAASRGLVVSVVETAVRIVHFLQNQPYQIDSFPATTFRMTQSQYQLVLQSVLRTVEHDNHHNRTSNTAILKACAPWIEMLNLHWIFQLTSRTTTPTTTTTTMTQSTEAAVPCCNVDTVPKRDLALLERLLPVAIRTLQHQDKSNGDRESDDEAMTQWRVLTGFYIVHVAQFYEANHKATTTTCKGRKGEAVSEWLQDMYLDLSGNNIHNLLLREQAATVARQFLELLQTYLVSLNDFVLDALDAVAMIGMLPPSDTNGKNGLGEHHDCYFAAAENVLRHITLVLHALEAIGPWNLVSLPQICTLWTNLSRSFIAADDTTTASSTYKTPPQLPPELDLQFCNALLRFSSIAGKLLHDTANTTTTSSCPTAEYACALSMTLLRAAKYPDRVLETEPFWALIQHALTTTSLSCSDDSEDNIRRVCQLAVLSPQAAACHKICPEQQTQYNQIRKRLAKLLIDCTGSTSKASGCNDGWDSYVLMQFQTLSILHH